MAEGPSGAGRFKVGRWGTTYLYGTWCAVKALAAAHISAQDTTLLRAKEWLLNVQREDGGFGESCQSDLNGKFSPLHASQPSQTAWGLDALLSLFELEPHLVERTSLLNAASRTTDWLLDKMKEGYWKEEIPTGSAFPGALHIRYEIYPKIWPLLALSHYQRVMRDIAKEIIQ